MNSRICLLLTLLFQVPAIFSQNKTVTVSLYYQINEVVSPAHTLRLDSVFSALNGQKTTVAIYGYADYLSSDAYNKSLSQKRAAAVKNYIMQHFSSKQITIGECSGLGEKNSRDTHTKEGEPQQRRVDLVITEQLERKKIGTRQNEIQATPEIKKTEVPAAKENTLSKLNVQDLKKGENYTIEGLNFIPGRHVLVKSAVPVLAELLKTLKEHPNLKIEIQGHICCLDDEVDGLDYDTQEMKLSENRAKSIYNYLIRNGIDEERLSFKGYGHTNPKIKHEMTPEDEQVNRRVEIKVLEN